MDFAAANDGECGAQLACWLPADAGWRPGGSPDCGAGMDAAGNGGGGLAAARQFAQLGRVVQILCSHPTTSIPTRPRNIATLHAMARRLPGRGRVGVTAL